MRETCNYRSLSWLVKSCVPDDPRREIAAAAAAGGGSGGGASISSLPDDILVECLSRVPRSSLPSLPLVSRRFCRLLRSPAFHQLRRRRPTLLALSLPHLAAAPLPLSAWRLSALPSPPSVPHARLAAVGRFIFIIGRSATLRFDSLTGSVAPRAPTLFPRKKFAAAAIGGKIYVAGGSTRTSAVEEYDPDADAWRVVAEAPARRCGCVGAAAGGVFYIVGGLRVGGLDAAGTMDAYRVAAGAWLRTRGRLPDGGCAVGACGVGAHVYVLASHHAVEEVAFWRWRRGGEAWERLAAPPVAGRGGAVRFSCCAIGESSVVAVADDAGGGEDPAVVLVYDVAAGEWGRGPDLPAALRRAACVCVDC